MQPNTSRFSRLVDLAKETSSDKRRELLREVTDVFLGTAPDCTDTEKSYFGDIIGKVSTGMDIAVRRQLAARLADNPDAPRALVQQFANDDFTVASEVLSKSPVLQDSDLISIASSKNQHKLGAIATRKSIPESVSDAIVQHGDDEVVVQLVSNTGAQVSRETFSRVIERSETSTVLQAPLVDRNDLPVDMLNEMFTFVKSDLRDMVRQKLSAVPPEVLEKALLDAQSEVMADIKQMKDADRKAMVFVTEMASQKKLNETLLIHLSRSLKAVELIHAFARLSEIDVKTIRRIFNAKNIEGVAIISRSMRFERGTFSTIAMSLVENLGSSTSNIHEILAVYEQVTSEAAQRVMRFWRVRKEVCDATAKA
ncbi:MAG: DUF2336 domain-containing protein [Micropepsaceae bacterium]